MKFFVVGFFVMGAVFGSKRNQTHVSSETSLTCDATNEYVWNRKYPSTWYGLSIIEIHGSDLFGQDTQGLVGPTIWPVYRRIDIAVMHLDSALASAWSNGQNQRSGKGRSAGAGVGLEDDDDAPPTPPRVVIPSEGPSPAKVEQ